MTATSMAHDEPQSFDEVITNYLKNSAGPLAAEIGGGDFSDEEIQAVKQQLQAMLDRRAQEAKEEHKVTPAQTKETPPNPFVDQTTGVTYFTPSFARLPRWPAAPHDAFTPPQLQTPNAEAKPIPEWQTPSTAPTPQPPSSPIARTAGTPPPQPQATRPARSLEPAPQTAHIPAPAPRGSQPNPSTIRATTQPPPSILLGQPTSEQESALQFKQRQEQDRLNPAETIDEQIDQDENIADLADSDEEDENQNYKQVARRKAQELEQKLRKQRVEKKNARQLALIAQPFFMGVTSGGFILIGMLITFPIGILLAIFGGVGVLLSLFIYAYNAPRRALKKGDAKTPKELKANRPAIEAYQSDAKKIINRHNYDVMAEVPTELQKRSLFHAIFQPMGVSLAVISGILLIPITVLVLAFAGCQFLTVGSVDPCSGLIKAYEALVKTGEAIGDAVFEATHNTNPCPTGTCVELEKPGG